MGLLQGWRGEKDWGARVSDCRKNGLAKCMGNAGADVTHGRSLDSSQTPALRSGQEGGGGNVGGSEGAAGHCSVMLLPAAEEKSEQMPLKKHVPFSIGHLTRTRPFLLLKT